MKKICKKIKKIPAWIMVMFLRFYQACISPLFPGCCRFRPTCSEYAIQSFTKFGFFKGIILTFKRLSKCHPFGGRGYDPIPEKFEFRNKCKCSNDLKRN